MTKRQPFRMWAVLEVRITEAEFDLLLLGAAFELLVSRCELARRRGSRDPVATGSTRYAGGNSRVCTKRMLEHLGYTPHQRRAVQRLLTGTAGGWPGLLRLYADERHLSVSDRQYARRQVRVFIRPPRIRTPR